MSKHTKTRENSDYQPMLYHDKPADTERRRRSYPVGRAVVAVTATAGLATGLTVAGNAQRHHTERQLTKSSDSPFSQPWANMPPSATPTPDQLPPNVEANPNANLGSTLTPMVQGYAERVITWVDRDGNTDNSAYFASGNLLTLTYIVDGGSSGNGKESSYKFVVTGEADATGTTIDASTVSELTLEADFGTRSVFSESYSQDLETGEWTVNAMYAANRLPVTFNLSTDPDAAQVGKEPMTLDTLNDVYASANTFMSDAQSKMPVTPNLIPVPDFQPDPVYPSVDPGLQV